MQKLTFDEMLKIINEVPAKRKQAKTQACKRFNELKENMQMISELLAECEKCQIDTRKFEGSSYKNNNIGFNAHAAKYPNKIVFECMLEGHIMIYDGNILEYDSYRGNRRIINIEESPIPTRFINLFCEKYHKCRDKILKSIGNLPFKSFDYE